MKRTKRKTPAGLAGGYIDTIEAFRRFTDWGDTFPEDKEDMCSFMEHHALPTVRLIFANPAEYHERMATLIEATPKKGRADLCQVMQVAAQLVDLEKRPGRIAKTKARALRLRILSGAELARIRAAQRRMEKALAGVFGNRPKATPASDAVRTFDTQGGRA